MQLLTLTQHSTLTVVLLFQEDHLDTTWQYTIRWHPGDGGTGGSRTDRSAVVVTSKQRRRNKTSASSAVIPITFGGFEVDVWTSAETSDIVTSSHPLAVFASVMAR